MHVAYVDGRTDGQAMVGCGRHRRQAASADQLRARIEGSGGGWQPKSRCHASGVAYDDGRAGGYRQSRSRAA